MKLSGGSKWAILLATIIVLEALPGPTLSSAHAQGVIDPRVRIPVLLLHFYLVAHLWKLIPDQFDPLRNLDKLKVARNTLS